MSIRFDEKGKFFTDVISKEAVAVIIQTGTNRIRGMIHLKPGIRFKDQINQTEIFLAITEATIYSLSGSELYRCDFLAINREQVIWILPEDQVIQDQTGEQESEP